MKILIVGHKGMLGSALVEKCKGQELLLWDLPEIDISQEETVERIVAENPEFVINTAGYTDVDGCESNKKEAKMANSEGVIFLAEGCEKINTPIIHFSTDYVFKGDKEDGYDENEKTDPINTYGKTKADGEKNLKKNTEAFFLVRTSGLYGPNGKNFVDTMLEKAKTGEEIRVVNDQYLKFTYTYDLAESIIKLIDLQPEYGVYHMVNEGILSWYEFAQKIFKQANLSPNLVSVSSSEFKSAAKRPAHSALINKKFEPLRSLDEALADYISKRKSSE
ncbi:dTDP-4-dehydrorhamnose reductase [Patescibacteria group bacterium]|nr:dTDP-4-dehydrorhamnose reductase [Patescibacteria group bacterium]MBU1890118.1 dTDP-4-dehydrorhamnose reductase [Patescibacteria group bacterium]